MKPRGWPVDWAERKAGRDCSMCVPIRDFESRDLTTLAVLPASTVSLARHSRLAGYCIVTWRGRHVAEPFELTVTEAAAYWADVTQVAEAVNRAFTPMKMNLTTLGNWGPHLHTHVVPRYRDDPAPGDPINYVDMISDEPLPQDVLEDHANRLRPILFSPQA